MLYFLNLFVKPIDLNIDFKPRQTCIVVVGVGVKSLLFFKACKRDALGCHKQTHHHVRAINQCEAHVAQHVPLGTHAHALASIKRARVHVGGFSPDTYKRTGRNTTPTTTTSTHVCTHQCARLPGCRASTQHNYCAHLEGSIRKQGSKPVAASVTAHLCTLTRDAITHITLYIFRAPGRRFCCCCCA